MNTNEMFAAVAAPNPVESDYEITDVEGEIPRSLFGSLLRNGPNQHILPAAGSEAMSFFEGDGMVRRIQFEDGRATFKSRWVRSPAFSFEAETGFYCMGGSNLGPDREVANAPQRTLHNTNVVLHNNQLFAMAENSAPRLLDPQSLETLSDWDFSGRAAGEWTTAHPKLDASTGQMVLHGYSTSAPFLQFYVVEADGSVSVAEPMDAPWPSLFHDLAISEHYAIVPLGSAFYDPGLVQGTTRQVWDCLVLDPEKTMRFGVRERTAGAELRWLEVPTLGNIFHVGNAYERNGHIVLDACTYKTPETISGPAQMRTSGAANVLGSALYLYELDTESGAVTETQLDDIPYEFPRIDDRYVGQKNRYVFATTGPGGQNADASMRRVTRYDFQTGLAQHAPVLDGRWVGEPVFVPLSDDADEGEGFVLAMIFDGQREATGVEIRDASNVDKEALATLWLKERMPFDFHGNWAQDLV